MTFESYKATVRGIIWDGGRGYTSYTFGHLPTRAEVLAKSGDFQLVTGISLKRTTTTIEACKLAA